MTSKKTPPPAALLVVGNSAVFSFNQAVVPGDRKLSYGAAIQAMALKRRSSCKRWQCIRKSR